VVALTEGQALLGVVVAVLILRAATAQINTVCKTGRGGGAGGNTNGNEGQGAGGAGAGMIEYWE
jgi:hypothetical protein